MREELSVEPSVLSLRREFTRKGIHFLSLSIPLCYEFDLVSYPVIVTIVTAITLVLSLLDILRMRFSTLKKTFFRIFGDVVRSHEHRFLTGSTFLLISFTCVLFVYPKPIAVAVMGYTVLGDSVASLVGKKWGRLRFGRRSLEGSAACFLTCLLVGSTIEGLTWSLVIVGSVVATMVEGFSDRADDNLTIPILTGLAMLGWTWWFGLDGSGSGENGIFLTRF